MSSPLTSANIHWQDGTPISDQFDDSYFNTDSGLEESDYVFVAGNNLAERFNTLKPYTRFTIGETGFGTGLNFFLACQSWLENAPENARLHFVTAECFPLTLQDLISAIHHWPQFSALGKELIAQYPAATKGFHRLYFAGGRISLTLMFMPAEEAYSAFEGSVDAWFLDGFSPAKNPSMWTEALFTKLAALSHPDTTLATFTAAGFVRRGLDSAGFVTSKRPGIGMKREVISARFSHVSPSQETTELSTTAPKKDKSGAIQKPWFKITSAATQNKKVLILGAGLAGASTAYALALKGYKVTVVDKANAPATGGSGNYQGGLYTKLPVSWTLISQLQIEGMGYSGRILASLDKSRSFHSIKGLLQLAHSDNERKRQDKLATSDLWVPHVAKTVSDTEARAISQGPTKYDGLFIPLGGWASPPEFCTALLSHENINLVLNTQVDSLTYDKKSWQLTTDTGMTLDCPTVVICTAHDVKGIEQTAYLPVKPIRGQTSVVDAKLLPEVDCLVCGDGYYPPPHNGKVCFGSSFDLRDKSIKIRDSDNEENLKKVSSMLELNQTSPITNISGRVSFRCSTPDYAPIVGPVVQSEQFLETYKLLSRDKNWQFGEVEDTNLPGLYVNTGHGSKGLITAPVSGEIIASLISGDPLPVMRDVYHAIHPSRFMVRELIKGKHT